VSSFSGRVLRAIHWNFVLSIATVLIQLATTAGLARLLTPADYGLFALPYVFAILALHLSQRGITLALVREPHLDERDIGTAVVLSLAAGLLLSGALVLAAPVFAWLSGAQDRDLAVALIRVMSLPLLLGTLSAVPSALLQRTLAFRATGLCALAGILLGNGLVAIVTAALGWGVWSLVAGNVANYAVALVLITLAARPALAWRLDWSRLHYLANVGIRYTGLRIVDIAWVQAPFLLGGHLLSVRDLGLYNRAQFVADISTQFTVSRTSVVLFPAIASRMNDENLLGRTFLGLLAAYALFLLPMSAFVAATATILLEAGLGFQWAPAAPLLALLIFAFSMIGLAQPATMILEAKGWLGPRYQSGLTALGLFIALAILLGRNTANGVAVAAAVSAGIGTAMSLVQLCRLLQISSSRLVMPIVAATLLAVAVAIAAQLGKTIGYYLAPSSVVQFIVASAFSGTAFAAGMRWALTPLLRGELFSRLLALTRNPGLPSTAVVLFLVRLWNLAPNNGHEDNQKLSIAKNA